MADDKTLGPDESNEPVSPDPLGIIGWKVGGKYVIRSYIGGGGFGEVYEGYNANLPDQRLVFKFFKRVQQRSKFDKEARILCMLDHPNISRVIDYLPDEGAVVVAFIDGEDGRQIIKRSGAISEEDFLKVAKALTDAIAYAHEKSIAHRDLKPGNIMFDVNGHVYLIDFGIAKEIGDVATKTAYQALTPMFAAPERQEGDTDYNPFLSDIFEAGVTLYNFATNDLPYRNPANPNYNEWGGEAAKKLTGELRRILMRMTHPDPEQRYRTAREMANEFKNLDKAYRGEEDIAEESKKGSSWMIIMAIIIIVLAAGGYFGRHRIKQFVDRQQDNSSEQVVVPEDDDIKTQIDSILNTDSSAAMTEDSSEFTMTDNDSTDSDLLTGNPLEQPVREMIENTDSLIKPADSTPEPKEVVEEKEEKKAVKPTRFDLKIDAVPTGVSYVTVNGDSADGNHIFKLKPGIYEISIFHREYPIYTETVQLGEEGLNKYVDMGTYFAANRSANLNVDLIPETDKHFVDMTFNGKWFSLNDFPSNEIYLKKGRWDISANITAVGGAPGKIDSILFFTDSGSREKIAGNRGQLDFSTGKYKNDSIPVTIYWSPK